ncbi:hypothetical protein Q670_04215 [Alcanivorax sp. P2S70]|uniref:hypothetical protein n=1 Tax=Alcanivorax sp. P2S70 TaxID=1397527 RepID=UPI0003B451F6|nr:hypothetical protein [Alcanivorax sp. P2S70]ERP89606.1 hypothetical protein Q670_04215 [Alcanivorax sp. P2S70]
MAPLIVLALYGLMFLVVGIFVPMDMSNESRLAFNLFGGAAILFGPLVIFSFIDQKLDRVALSKFGSTWCVEQGVEFSEVKIYKNHFALLYTESGAAKRKKFRAKFIPTTWHIKEVEWLEK